MITIYSTPTCAFCHMAKEYLKSKNIEFKDIDVSRDPNGAHVLLEKSGQLGVPVLDVNGKIIVGFNRPMLDEALSTNKSV